MIRILLFIILSSFCTFSFSQERNDGLFVVHLMETDAQDLKCEIGVTANHIKSLMDNGRHVISVVPTKFGSIALHKKAETNMAQQYIHIPSYDFKKEAKKLFKEGYVIENYNGMSFNAIASKNPTITKQEYVGQPKQKDIKKQNNKGLYVKLGCKTEAIAQDALNGIISQERKFYIRAQHFIDDFKEMTAAGYILGSIETSYNKYDNNTYFTVIYDKPQQQYSGKQLIGIFETKDEFIAFLNENVTDKCNITGLWGGWENRDYAADARLASASSESVVDVLFGLGNSVLQLTNGAQSTESSHNDVNDNVSTATGNSSKSKTRVGKCRYCAGSGTCSATSSAGRKNACNGSGLCGHCSGTGWIKAGGSEAKCTACNGTGKCKSCKGTGKCSHCHGTGK